MSEAAVQDQSITYTLDCTKCTEQSLFSTDDLKEYLLGNIKYNGKKGQLGKKVLLSNTGHAVDVFFAKKTSKRYLKYLIKKFLRAKGLSDWVRPIAGDKQSYKFSFFSKQAGEE
ncbi:60S ribosomal protein L22 [Spraguea lophii 42_110]|uniref:Large ribosomal subunit protein eL22 n=1 Tax=Spraguea lophii (strain 42_110) TaxID=1358809 RepID=S7W958_SPRLO|nr:Chain LU0, 60S ribosomal protein L22 [Spraguea lophii 42_110]7QJH_KU0 Chain KU0, 60S ribosomal protein L22 [Spraguea lophii 42_110]7QJH_LU0 Chain LU0, 60S ribosomal protein L22 [Spraguea lophii 42_110]8BR3_LU0 Chain LU0, 60S ribosomal protein L22 [Spraguea lophii 42_110]8P5D_LU0 Chain LU0, 60S ribosomal protein L22 [Spraguea lophii 42_110]8P60_KU0 Chain KU0, 60S ribosomal protein L22 [Spraguea lophii 42_110]8P60_LU0 Chain LU0, 60S ribosomal protein L22 [Spraguea lophii 42_110]EPR78232.1 6